MPISRRFSILLVLALAVVSGLWSAAWVYARGRVDLEIERVLAREAGQGRQIACSERSISGYPFHIAVKCAHPVFAQIRGQQIEVAAASLVGSAAVWAPRRVAIDVVGPLRVAEPGPGGREFARAEFALGQVVVVQETGGLRSLAVVADTVSLALSGGTLQFRAPHAELRLDRRTTDGVDRLVDAGIVLSKLQAPFVLPGTRGPLDVEVDVTLSAAESWQGTSMPERLRSWGSSGGRAKITRLRLVSDGAATEASGDVALDARGRLNGTLRVLVVGLDQVLGDLVQARAIPREMMTVVPTLNAIGAKGEIAGRPALSLPVRLRDGLIMIGPVPIGAVPPLY